MVFVESYACPMSCSRSLAYPCASPGVGQGADVATATYLYGSLREEI